MAGDLRAALHFGLLSLAIASADMAAAQPASPPQLQVRLETHLTSYTSRPGSAFRCVVICPYETDGQILIPAGSVVRGTVRKRQSVRLGFVHERASLDLSFSEYETPDGEVFPLSAKLASIDNAREEVTPQGRIKGVLAASNPDEMLSGIWEKPSLNMLYRPLAGLTGVSDEILEKFPMGPVGPAILLGVRCFLLRFPEPEIHLPPGTDMRLTINESLSRFEPEPVSPAPQPSAELAEWLGARPLDVEKPNGRHAEDVINVVFAGSWQQILDAFYASGWSAAQPTTFGTFSRVYVAYNGKKLFPTAPVSTLLYQGKPPDVVFEKSFDTVTKRHHVRIWRAGSFEGREIWLGAATHDTGVKFDSRTFRFTHRIDKNVDAERAKVAVDLNFAGCTEPVSFVAARQEDSPDARSKILTDGRVAVLSLQPCSKPQDADAEPVPGPPGNRLSRFVRRAVLETRSYILRENCYYWAYQLIRRH